MSLLDRGLEIKTPDQIALMRRAGLLVGETLELLRAAARPGVTTGDLDRLPQGNIPSPRGVPSVPWYGHPTLPAHDLRVGERRGRARHPRVPRARRRRRDLHRLRCHRRGLAR